MKSFVSSTLLIAMSSAAFAQSAPPAATQPAAPPPAAAQPVPLTANVTVNTTAPPMQARLQLTPEDQNLLADGEISTGAHIGGGLVSLMFGFGTGHIVQGRWGDRGWIFTLGESASLGVMIYGIGKMASSCTTIDETGDCGTSGTGFVLGGAVALTALHVWEVVDAFVAPIGHNRRVRQAQLRHGMRFSSVTPYFTPTAGDGAVGGLSLKF
jgi:hypothetical protein